jgi:hypothetical protein
MKTKILLSVVAVLITGIAAFGAISSFAQTTIDPQTSIIQKIAQKFGLNEADVKAVFDEERIAHEKEMQAQSEEKLAQLVIEGKITEAQKKLIIAKQAELRKQREANRDAIKNLTPEERKTKMHEERTALESWAQENGLDIRYVFIGMGPMHGLRFGRDDIK